MKADVYAWRIMKAMEAAPGRDHQVLLWGLLTDEQKAAVREVRDGR